MKRILRILASPVCHVAHLLHVRYPHLRSKKVVKCTLGGFITLVGAYAATNPVDFVPHFVWDAGAYALHGWGLVPILKVSAAYMEDI